MSVLLPNQKKRDPLETTQDNEAISSETVITPTSNNSSVSSVPIWRPVMALAVAALADAVFLLPIEPFEMILDVIVGLILCAILGFNFIFFPTLLVELVPGVDVFPTWTLAVLAITGVKLMKQK